MPSQNETSESISVPTSTLEGAARIKQLAVQQIKWARGFVNALLAGVADDQLLHRPGGKGNHSLWVMGHLASSDDQILAMMTGSEPTLPQSFHDLFQGGSEPSDDREVYPSREEVAKAMQETHDRLVAWVESLDEDTMNTEAPEFLRPFAPDMISVPFSVSAHDLCHAGQVSTARASLGLKRLMM